MYTEKNSPTNDRMLNNVKKKILVPPAQQNSYCMQICLMVETDDFES